MDGFEPETEISGEERVIDCGAMGIVRWEISQAMWDFLAKVPEADRERILDIMTDKLHQQCHGICEYVFRFVDQKSANENRTAEEQQAGDSFPESWLHD